MPVPRPLPKGPAGQVDAGPGKTLPAGRPGLIAPTRLIVPPFGTQGIDGAGITFQLAPDTEAPGLGSVVLPDRLLGWPHEEGIDYPEGESCPQCPYWRNRDRFTGLLRDAPDES